MRGKARSSNIRTFPARRPSSLNGKHARADRDLGRPSSPSSGPHSAASDAEGAADRVADQAAQAQRLQELRRAGRAADRAGPDRGRRPQRLRQVQPARSDPLGDGRIQPQVAARRRHGRRDLRRHRDAAAARFRRSLDPARARRRTTTATPRESEVTRRIERGAGSAYRIDGRDVRAKDVALLFADAATGAHSPALVSQGKIGAVIAAKPVERRLLLEEAAGISGLHARRKDAEQKLRATEANLARLGEILSRPGAARRAAAAAGARGRALSQADRRDSLGRGAAAPRALGRGRARGRGGQCRGPGAPKPTSRRSSAAIAEAQAAQERPNAALTERRNALAELRASRRTSSPTSWRRRGRGATRSRGGSPSSTGSTRRSTPTSRARKRCKGDAAAAIAQLEEERAAIEQRLDDAEAQAARIAAELSAAEAASREAEAALAELLARQAAMRAERRVAEAALEAAQAQLAPDRAGTAQSSPNRLPRSATAASRATRATKPKRKPQAAADGARRRRKPSVSRPKQGRAAAAEQRDAAESQLAVGPRRSVGRASRSMMRSRGRSNMAAARRSPACAAEPGYERALAAALGEDADAAIGEATARGAGRAARRMPGDPRACRAGASASPTMSTAPPELARRLAPGRGGERTTGQALAVGQRLVTLDGRLRRWDGFVAKGAGAAAAERLLRANRLAELARRAARTRTAVEAALAERDCGACRNGTMPRGCRGGAARGARRRARCARRGAGERCGGRGARADRGAARRVSTQRQRRPRAGARGAARGGGRRRAVAAALPDPAALEHDVEARARQPRRRCVGGRRQARRSRDQGARDRRRSRAPQRRRHASRPNGASARPTPSSGSPQAIERQKQQAAERAELSKRAGRARRADRRARARQRREPGRGRRSRRQPKREAEEARRRGGRRGQRRRTSVRPMRANAAPAPLRAPKAQQARSAEFAQACVEKFECVPQRLPEKLGFDPDESRDPDAEAATLERLTAERERIGPVNLVAEQRAGRARRRPAPRAPRKPRN